ncbi:MAG TPA: hypothetical protein VK578_15440 [Edaphobacter sp.]|nr:hypothetical protein [Edaphobacter sp.]
MKLTFVSLQGLSAFGRPPGAAGKEDVDIPELYVYPALGACD